MRTLTGDCTSSEDVAEAWSLSPSDPIFKSSCTISGSEDRGRADQLRSGAPGHPLLNVTQSLITHVHTTPQSSLESLRERVARPREVHTGQDRLNRGGGGNSHLAEHPIPEVSRDWGWPRARRQAQ